MNFRSSNGFGKRRANFLTSDRRGFGLGSRSKARSVKFHRAFMCVTLPFFSGQCRLHHLDRGKLHAKRPSPCTMSRPDARILEAPVSTNKPREQPGRFSRKRQSTQDTFSELHGQRSFLSSLFAERRRITSAFEAVTRSASCCRVRNTKTRKVLRGSQ